MPDLPTRPYEWSALSAEELAALMAEHGDGLVIARYIEHLPTPAESMARFAEKYIATRTPGASPMINLSDIDGATVAHLQPGESAWIAEDEHGTGKLGDPVLAVDPARQAHILKSARVASSGPCIKVTRSEGFGKVLTVRVPRGTKLPAFDGYAPTVPAAHRDYLACDIEWYDLEDCTR